VTRLASSSTSPRSRAISPRAAAFYVVALQLQEPGNYIYAQRAFQRLGRQDLLRRLQTLRPLLRPGHP